MCIRDRFIAEVFAVMARCTQHTFQVLTKRHGRMRSLLASGRLREKTCQVIARDDTEVFRRVLAGWPLPNVHLGVSVEDQAAADLRIPALLDAPAAVRWLSCEPLLGAVDLSRWMDTPLPEGAPLAMLDWVVVGGESGAGARPMHPDWARSLRDQCTAAGVPFFFKQWGAHIPLDHAGRVYGGIRDALPDGRWSLHDRARADGGVAMVPFRASFGHGRALDGRTWDQYPAVTAR